MSKSKNEENVNKIIIQFKNNLFAINEYFKNFGVIANDTDTGNINKLKDLIDDTLKDVEIVEGEKEKILLTSKQVDKLLKGLKESDKVSFKNFEILSRSSFLMLNNYFEYLLSDLLAYYYNKYQNSLNEKNFNIALKELSEYESLEEFTKSLITKEIESMMVEFSFKELLEHFQNNLGIDNEKDIINWDLLTECRERRHLIVHNASKVNKKYLSRVKNPHDYKIGDLVKVNQEYFTIASQEFYLAGLLISFNCWGKWDKETATNTISEILDETFELLKSGDHSLVEKITRYCKTIEARDDKQEDCLLRLTFNRLIALKKLKDPNLSKELKKLKIGTASPIFKLAYAILGGNHKNIIELVNQAYAIGDIGLDSYLEWPIFEFLREIPEINSKIEAALKSSEQKSGKKATKKTALNVKF